ncbi:MAG: O-antigen ligase family protein, partial [bacterium]
MDVAIATRPKAEETARDDSRTLFLLALVIAVAVAPVLPPIAWKVNATLLATLLVAGGFYLRIQGEASAGRSALDHPALAFLAAAVLATAFSVEPLVSFFPSRYRGEGLIVYIPYVAVALAAARFADREAQRVVVAVLAGGVLIGLIALPQYYGIDSLQALGFRTAPPTILTGPNPAKLSLEAVWIGARAYGTLANPIFLGAYATLLLPLAVALAMHAKARAAWAYGAAALMLYAALVVSQTRSAWISAAASALVLIWLLPKSPGVLRRGALLIAGFVIVTATLVLTRPDASLLRRASATFGANDYSMRQKFYVWKHTLPLIAQRPLFGWGFSTLIGQFKDMGSPEYLSVFGTGDIVLVDSPHNELLHVAYSTGLIGLTAYLWLWAAAAHGLLRRPRAGGASHETGSASSALRAGLAASLVGYAVWLQFGWNVIGPANAFWVILGLAAAQAGGASTESADRCTVN